VRLIGIIDMEDNPSAEAMADAIIWAICVRAKLDIHQLIYFVTDNTASMSGTGVVGGCCDILRRSFDLRELVPRGPCSLHSLHVGVSKARQYMYFGKLPNKNDRETRHIRTQS
jgi:hypothetical protein